MTKTPQKTLNERIVDADIRASMYLGNANEAEERGDHVLSEKLRLRCQFWLDRYTVLTNQANHAGPKR